MKAKSTKWDLVINSRRGLFDLNLVEIWKYRDLIRFLIKRDYKAIYKQTVLGPIWLFIQPLLSSIVYVLIFNKIAKIPTDQIPPYLFYLSGIILWNYFLSCLNSTSNTFGANSTLFSKVYFPRIVDPISKVISNLIRLFIQFFLFLAFYIYYVYIGIFSYSFNYSFLLLIPILIIHIAIFGQGLGMLVSSMTTKYRDLNYLISFGSQLLMYATPIVYPIAIVPENYKIFIQINPLTSIVESFRYIFLGTGTFSLFSYSLSFFISTSIFFIGLIFFNKVEKNFVDTI